MEKINEVEGKIKPFIYVKLEGKMGIRKTQN